MNLRTGIFFFFLRSFSSFRAKGPRCLLDTGNIILYCNKAADEIIKIEVSRAGRSFFFTSSDDEKGKVVKNIKAEI